MTETVVESLTLMQTFCPGRPKTKGSMTARPNGSMHDTPASSKWRSLVARSALMARQGRYGDLWKDWPGPVSVACVFYLPAVDVTAARSGDLDKLVRNVLDALTDADVYADDVQVVRVVAEKVAATDLMRPGVWVSVKTCVAG
jgi:Holliday junction resolvase RusA-like endonuclease